MAIVLCLVFVSCVEQEKRPQLIDLYTLRENYKKEQFDLDVELTSIHSEIHFKFDKTYEEYRRLLNIQDSIKQREKIVKDSIELLTIMMNNGDYAKENQKVILYIQ